MPIYSPWSEESRAYQQAWRKANPDKLAKYKSNDAKVRKGRKLKAKYGITLLEYEDMLLAQSNKCAICLGDAKTETMCVDHCHVTGRVRGLLCNNCNTALGCLKDNADACQAAANYLRLTRV